MTGDAARLHAAQELLLRFIQAGRSLDVKAQAALQRSPAGWPVSRDDLARQIKQRLDGKLPDQLETSYCGPAAFLACLIHDRPDIYVAYAVSLWREGRFSFGNRKASLAIDSGQGVVSSAAQLAGTRKSDPGHRHINDVDWMTMSCLSASTRPFNFHSVGPNDEFGSITYPAVLRRWFMAAGATVRADAMGAGLLNKGLLEVLPLMRYWPSGWIVLQIDYTLLQPGDPKFLGNRHWVVVDPHHQPLAYERPGATPIPLGDVTGKMMDLAAKRLKDGGGVENVDEASIADAIEGRPFADWTVDLRVITWAEAQHGIYTGKLGRLIDRVFGGYAFSRLG